MANAEQQSYTMPLEIQEKLSDPNLLIEFGDRTATIMGKTGTMLELAEKYCPVDLNDPNISTDMINAFVVKVGNKAGWDVEERFTPVFAKVCEERKLEPAYKPVPDKVAHKAAVDVSISRLPMPEDQAPTVLRSPYIALRTMMESIDYTHHVQRETKPIDTQPASLQASPKPIIEVPIQSNQDVLYPVEPKQVVTASIETTDDVDHAIVSELVANVPQLQMQVTPQTFDMPEVRLTESAEVAIVVSSNDTTESDVAYIDNDGEVIDDELIWLTLPDPYTESVSQDGLETEDLATEIVPESVQVSEAEVAEFQSIVDLQTDLNIAASYGQVEASIETVDTDVVSPLAVLIESLQLASETQMDNILPIVERLHIVIEQLELAVEIEDARTVLESQVELEGLFKAIVNELQVEDFSHEDMSIVLNAYIGQKLSITWDCNDAPEILSLTSHGFSLVPRVAKVAHWAWAQLGGIAVASTAS